MSSCLPGGIAAQEIHAIKGAAQYGFEQFMAVVAAALGRGKNARRVRDALKLAADLRLVAEGLKDGIGNGRCGVLGT